MNLLNQLTMDLEKLLKNRIDITKEYRKSFLELIHLQAEKTIDELEKDKVFSKQYVRIVGLLKNLSSLDYAIVSIIIILIVTKVLSNYEIKLSITKKGSNSKNNSGNNIGMTTKRMFEE